MFKNLLFKVYNVTVCGITLQASLDTVDSEYLKLLPKPKPKFQEGFKVLERNK